MSTALIKIVYRQVITAKTVSAFEKQVLKISYEEFLLKSQAYNCNGSIQTFTAMKAADGRANSLHYKTGFAVDGLINLLNKQIPGLQDGVGQPILFDSYRFEVLESDITDPSAHIISIWYYTETLTLLNQFGNHLLLAYGNRTQELSAADSQNIENSFLLPLQTGMSIAEYTAICNTDPVSA